MSDGAQAQRIIALLTGRPGLDDDEIAGALVPDDLATTLLVIPCSGAKREYHAGGADGPAITQIRTS